MLQSEFADNTRLMNAPVCIDAKSVPILDKILAEMCRSLAAADPWIEQKNKLSPAREKWRPRVPARITLDEFSLAQRVTLLGDHISECRTEKGFVINMRGEKLSYGQLAPEAAKLPLSTAPSLKDTSRFHLIGRPVARLDTPAKCNDSAIFGIDVVVPGMLNAAIKTARSFTGQLVAIRNEADIMEMPGVRAVVKIPAMAIANEHAGSLHPQGPHALAHNAVCVEAGEVVLAPVAPAIAQALLHAAGRRLDVMPFPTAVFWAPVEGGPQPKT
jgi:CO/xanthine dehydrogenase Mo-binding subunit